MPSSVTTTQEQVRFGMLQRGEKFYFALGGPLFVRDRTGFKNLPQDAHTSRWFPLAMDTLVYRA